MGKIFCIVGKSSTGKDTIYKRLLEQTEIPLRQIVSYTTRPIRDGETDGLEYHFCTEAEKEELIKSGKVIEQRSYDTVYGIWDYFTVDDGQIDLTAENYLIIGTLESFVRIKRYYGESEVVPIYIDVEDGVRLYRALERERAQQSPRYEEMCRRFLADAKDFSEENLSVAGIERRFVNEDLSQTVSEIIRYIGGILSGENLQEKSDSAVKG